MLRQYLLASDFDQTLSFNDSGVVLSELIGCHSFHDKVVGLSQMNLVQQGAELSYLILHDPEFRRVRREHLIETGKRIRLKHDVALFARSLVSASVSIFERLCWASRCQRWRGAVEKFGEPPQVLRCCSEQYFVSDAAQAP